MSAEKTSQVNLRISPFLKERAEEMAAKDSRSLTSLVEHLLTQHIQNRGSLRSWHDQAMERFEELALAKGAADIITPRSYRAFSFRVFSSTGFECKPIDMVDIARSLHKEVKSQVHPRFFNVYRRDEILPYLTTTSSPDHFSETDEILETALFPDQSPIGSVEFWRISPSGYATSIRPYFEENHRDGNFRDFPARAFTPFFLLRDLHEIILEAVALSKYFKDAESIEFRCELWGLQDREMADPDVRIELERGLHARIDHRITTGTWSFEALGDLSNVLDRLAGPIIRLFDPRYEVRWTEAIAQRAQPM